MSMALPTLLTPAGLVAFVTGGGFRRAPIRPRG